MKKPAYFNWSGGKDSALALYHVLKDGEYNVRNLLTSINGKFKRVSMHGVREELLDLQAESIGIDIKKIYLSEQPEMNEYNTAMKEAVLSLKNTGCDYSIFGDIFLEDLREYRENQLLNVGINAVFPLWKRKTKELLYEFLDLGFKTILVSIDASKLSKEFAGRIIDRKFINDLPENVDPCGENGEFHTFVFDGPIFKKPIPIKKGNTVFKEYKSPKDDQHSSKKEISGYWFCELSI